MSTTDGAPISAGVGMRLPINDRTGLRFDYAHGFEDASTPPRAIVFTSGWSRCSVRGRSFNWRIQKARRR